MVYIWYIVVYMSNVHIVCGLCAMCIVCILSMYILCTHPCPRSQKPLPGSRQLVNRLLTVPFSSALTFLDEEIPITTEERGSSRKHTQGRPLGGAMLSDFLWNHQPRSRGRSLSSGCLPMLPHSTCGLIQKTCPHKVDAQSLGLLL